MHIHSTLADSLSLWYLLMLHENNKEEAKCGQENVFFTIFGKPLFIPINSLFNALHPNKIIRELFSELLFLPSTIC